MARFAPKKLKPPATQKRAPIDETMFGDRTHVDLPGVGKRKPLCPGSSALSRQRTRSSRDRSLGCGPKRKGASALRHVHRADRLVAWRRITHATSEDPAHDATQNEAFNEARRCDDRWRRGTCESRTLAVGQAPPNAAQSVDLNRDLAAHWPLAGDAQDRSPISVTRRSGGRSIGKSPDRAAQRPPASTAATLPWRFLRPATPQLGTRRFHAGRLGQRRHRDGRRARRHRQSVRSASGGEDFI